MDSFTSERLKLPYASATISTVSVNNILSHQKNAISSGSKISQTGAQAERVNFVVLNLQPPFSPGVFLLMVQPVVGGSKGGCPPLSLGQKRIFWKDFCRKLHENERN